LYIRNAAIRSLGAALPSTVPRSPRRVRRAVQRLSSKIVNPSFERAGEEQFFVPTLIVQVIGQEPVNGVVGSRVSKEQK